MKKLILLSIVCATFALSQSEHPYMRNPGVDSLTLRYKSASNKGRVYLDSLGRLVFKDITGQYLISDFGSTAFGSDSIARTRTQPQKTFYVSPTYSTLSSPYFSKLGDAIHASSRGTIISLKAGEYTITGDSALTIPSGVAIVGDGRYRTIIRTTRKYAADGGSGTRFAYPVFRLNDSITVKDLSVICGDSVSAVFHDSLKKNIVYENVTIDCDSTNGSLITSYGGKNYFYNCKFNITNGDSKTGAEYPSVYQYNNLLNGSVDTSYWYNTEASCKIYVYGGTTRGYAEFYGCNFNSTARVGGNCLNLYEASEVWWNGGSLKGKIAAATVVRNYGAVKTHISNATIRASYKLYSSDFSVGGGVNDRHSVDSLWIDNCTVSFDSTSESVPNTVGFFPIGSFAKVTNTSMWFNKKNVLASMQIGGLPDVVDSTTHVVFDNVSLYNMGFKIWHNTDTHTTLFKANDFHVFIPDSMGNNDVPLYLDGIKRGSYIRNSSFETERQTLNHPNLPGIPFNMSARAADSVMSWYNVLFKATNLISADEGGQIRTGFKVSGNHLFTQCTWDFLASSYAAFVLYGSPTITMRNCVFSTGAVTAFKGIGTVSVENTTIMPKAYVSTNVVDIPFPLPDVGWTPLSSSTLQFWIRSDGSSTVTDGGTVNSITDKSTHSRSFISTGNPGVAATYSASAINGKPVVKFRTNDQFYINGSEILKDTTFTWFFVGRSFDSTSAALGEQSVNHQLRFGDDVTKNKNVLQLTTNSPSVFEVESSTLPISRSINAAYMIRRTGTTYEFWQNRVLVGSGNSFYAGAMWFGGTGHTPSSYFNGDIGEMALDSSWVSDSIADNWWQYAGDRWGLYTQFKNINVTNNIGADSIFARTIRISGQIIGSGHVISDPSNTPIAARDSLQFTGDGIGSVSNVGGRTVVSIPGATGYIPDSRTITINGTADQITSSAGAQDLSANRTWTLSLPSNMILPGTGGTTLPIGTTAQRPSVSAGIARYNSTLGWFDFYEGSNIVNYLPRSQVRDSIARVISDSLKLLADTTGMGAIIAAGCKPMTYISHGTTNDTLKVRSSCTDTAGLGTSLAGKMDKATIRTIFEKSIPDTMYSTDTLQLWTIQASTTVDTIQYDTQLGRLITARIEMVDSMAQTAGVTLIDSTTTNTSRNKQYGGLINSTTLTATKILRLVWTTLTTPITKGHTFGVTFKGQW